MKMDVLLGLQWGDEGKGKIVDVLSPDYDIIARFQGGPNAGHSLEFGDFKHVLHTIPSGIFRENTQNVIGNGVVIDPIIFKQEIDKIREIRPEALKHLFISKKAHLILPSHKTLDAASEKAKGQTKIGSTLKGIGPTYMDKTGRNGLRVGDILRPDFSEKYDFLKGKHLQLLRQYDFDMPEVQNEKAWFEGIECLKEFELIDGEYFINNAIAADKKILAEGAQGTLLDIEYGSYPYVTSSNTVSSGACTGLGVAPTNVGKVFGIFKSYCTRVGSGPFPTELFDNDGEFLQSKGHEFGATTGRKRRCGWLDLPSLKYSIMLNGVTDLIMTKSDVLSGLDKFKVATSYIIEGENIDTVPYTYEGEIKPVFKEFIGWKEDITKIKSYLELPVELKQYVEYIEKETGVPVNIVSVGPDRDETIVRI
ncbi:MAG: adenylosuccinate synthase [Bacteroidales bacterium]|nr:adenylosuccinate synthase [Bacteroidales bacterium]